MPRLGHTVEGGGVGGPELDYLSSESLLFLSVDHARTCGAQCQVQQLKDHSLGVGKTSLKKTSHKYKKTWLLLFKHVF